MTKVVDVNLINGLPLLLKGDAIYSTYIRKHLIFQGLRQARPTAPQKLHYVSAKANALITKMPEAALLDRKRRRYLPSRPQCQQPRSRLKNARCCHLQDVNGL